MSKIKTIVSNLLKRKKRGLLPKIVLDTQKVTLQAIKSSSNNSSATLALNSTVEFFFYLSTI